MVSHLSCDAFAEFSASLRSALQPLGEFQLLHGDRVLAEDAQHQDLEDLGIAASPQLQFVQQGMPEQLGLSHPENPDLCNGSYALVVGSRQWFYHDFDAAINLLARSGFPLVAQPIVRVSFSECVDFDVNSFITTISHLLGLPPCTTCNIAE